MIKIFPVNGRVLKKNQFLFVLKQTYLYFKKCKQMLS